MTCMRRRRPSIAAVAVAFIAAFVTAAAGDACTFSTLTVIQWSVLDACLRLVPFSSSLRNGLVAQLQNLANMYAFTDISTNASSVGSPYSTSVNLISEFSRIGSTTYASDFAMHKDINSVFQALGDAHTVYFGPSGYSSNFALVFPFQIAFSGSSSNALNWTITGQWQLLGTSYGVWAGVPTLPFSGTLQMINNMPPAQYFLQNVVPYYGYSKGNAGRLNSIMELMWNGPLFPLNTRYPYPQQNSWTMTINGVTYTVPVLFYVSNSIANANAIYTANTAVSSVSRTSKLDEALTYFTKKNHDNAQLVAFEEGRRFMAAIALHGRTLVDSQRLNSLSFKDWYEGNLGSRIRFSPMVQSFYQLFGPLSVSISGNITIPSPISSYVDPSFSVYCGTAFSSNGTRVMVMRISSFAPGSSTSSDAVSFLQVMQNCRGYAQTQGITRLVVDVRSNGGGLVALSYSAVAMLFSRGWGASLTTTLGQQMALNDYDLRQGCLFNTFYQNGLFDSNFVFLDASTMQTLSASSQWYPRSVTIARGSLSSGYTPRMLFPPSVASSFGSFGSSLLDSASTTGQVFASVILLTDGLCGSACNTFSSQAVFRANAMVVAEGGVTGDIYDIASFAGGFVLSWSSAVSLYQQCTTGTANSQNALASLPVTVSNQFTMAEIYYGTSSIPREFYLVQANYLSNTWDFQNDNAVYGSSSAIHAGLNAGSVPYGAALAYSMNVAVNTTTAAAGNVGGVNYATSVASQGTLTNPQYCSTSTAAARTVAGGVLAMAAMMMLAIFVV